MPTHFCQPPRHTLVALLIAPHLVHPERAVCLRYLAASRTFCLLCISAVEKFHKMSVPEASIHEDASAVFRQHHIWLPRQPRMTEPVTESTPPQPLPHHFLWLRVLAFYGRHIGVSLGRYWHNGIKVTLVPLRRVVPSGASWGQGLLLYFYDVVDVCGFVAEGLERKATST